MKSFLKISAALGFWLVLVGCQSKKVQSIDSSGSGVWQGKVRIFDQSNKRSLTGNIIWVSDALNNRLRIDVSAFFGISIATLIIESDEAWLWLHRERKFYGEDKPDVLFEKLAKIRMDPRVFFWILQDEPRMDPPWKCNKKGTVTSCLEKDQRLKARVINVRGQRKINLKQGSKSLSFSLQRSNVQVTEKPFQDKASLGYKQMNLL